MRATGKTTTKLRTTCRPSGVANPAEPARRWVRVGCRVLLTATILMSPALLAPTVLAHHFTGEVQLWASRIDFQDSPAGVLVSVLLVDRESGESVSGFGVTVSATDGSGTVVGPIELQESEFAVYSGTLSLSPGEWEILATTDQGNSSLPAIESAHRKTLEIDAAGRLVPSAGGGSAASTVVATVVPICVVAVLLLVVLRRRRLALDDAAGTGDAPAGNDASTSATGDDPAGDRDSR